MNKKLLLLLMVLISSTGQLLAQSWDSTAKITQVVVWNSDSTYTVYKCTDHPSVAVNETNLVITVNGTDVLFPANEVRKFTFDDEQLTVIEDVTTQGTYEITQDAINVDNLKDGTILTIYDTNGRLIAQNKSANGTVSVNISNLPNGVYVVKAGNTNFKFLKR